MKDENIIQNKFRTTTNNLIHYINHEKFCNGCIERNIIPTGVSIKTNNPLVFGGKSLLLFGEMLFSRRNKNC